MQPAAPSSVAAGQSSSVSDVSMVPSVDDCALRLGVIMLLVWSRRALIPVLPASSAGAGTQGGDTERVHLITP